MLAADVKENVNSNIELNALKKCIKTYPCINASHKANRKKLQQIITFYSFSFMHVIGRIALLNSSLFVFGLLHIFSENYVGLWCVFLIIISICTACMVVILAGLALGFTDQFNSDKNTMLRTFPLTNY